MGQLKKAVFACPVQGTWMVGLPYSDWALSTPFFLSSRLDKLFEFQEVISFSLAKAQEHILASECKVYPVMIWLLLGFSYYTGCLLK